MIEIIKDTIDYLNSKTNNNFSYEQLELENLIKESYSYADFVRVIDKKWSDWKGTDYEQYVRPSTLFGRKFIIYLHEQSRVSKSGIGKLASAVNKAKRTNWKLDNE
jgi:uncharacterized phage protein (TIGR02220 family)